MAKVNGKIIEHEKVLKLVCECDGELKSTGEYFATMPPKYIHVCDKCGGSALKSGERFPKNL